MKTSVAPFSSRRLLRRSGLLIALIVAIGALTLPFYSVDSSSRVDSKQNLSEGNLKAKSSSAGAKLRHSGWASTLSLPSMVSESIAVFAADCMTPKVSFNLGEVVCARTDGVDITTVPNNYYVNWTGPNGDTAGATITQNPQYSLFALPTSNTDVGGWKVNIGRVNPAENSIIGNPPNFTVGNDGPSIAIFASNCTTPKNVFNLQTADPGKTVCAKVTGGDASQSILWSNSNFELIQDVPLGSGQDTYTLTTGSSVGDWRVILFEPFGGSVYAVTPFTVIDSGNPSTDITVSAGGLSTSVAAGSPAVFSVQVTNLGPDTSTVTLTNGVPTNTTFYEFAPTTAPVGTNCVKPSVGASTGNVVCTIPNLARGETAIFLGTFDVMSETPSDTVISDTASLTSSTPDSSSANDSSTAGINVSSTSSATCTLDCPENVVVTANTTQGGQPGAVVTFGAATGSGDCGAITNSPPSGTFLTVGMHSIVSTSELGGASCTFTVTVLDTNPPTISCPAGVTVQLSSGQTEATSVNPGTPTINASGGGTVTGVRSDDIPAQYDENGNVVVLPVVHALTGPYPIGSTGILWTVKDAGGRTASCTQTITVVAAANRPPVTISCPGPVSVNAPNGSCEATISGATIGTPTTNPSDTHIHVVGIRSDSEALSAAFPAGVTVITWTATDDTNDSVASCTQNVTVLAGVGSDTTPPVLTVPPNISATTASCTVTLDDELGVPTATDTGSCGGTVSIARTGVPANFVFSTGTTTILYTATDTAGNTSTGVQLVTVTESPAILPTLHAPGSILTGLNTGGVGGTSCGTFVSDATLGTATASDNCPGAVVHRSGVPMGNIFPVGDTVITYTAEDKSGNFSAPILQTIRVVDNTPPIVTAPLPVTLTTGSGATICGVTVADLDATLGTASATDNCPNLGAIARSGVPAGNVFPVGQTTVTYSVTDDHGNTGSATQLVTVVDNTPPVITLNGQTPSLWPPNHKYQTFTVTNFVSSVFDNCGGVSVSDVVIDHVTSDETENGNGDGNTANDIVIASNCRSLQLRSERDGGGNGRVYTITFRLTDTHGNTSTVTANVVVPHNPGETPVNSGVHYTVNGGSCP